MPEHGEYNPGLKQWFCSHWMNKELWIEIHDYSPPHTGEDLISQEGSGDPPYTTTTTAMHSETAGEDHAKPKTEGTEGHHYVEESSNKNVQERKNN